MTKSIATAYCWTFVCCLLLQESSQAEVSASVGRYEFGQIELVPMSALQLGDAALVAPEVLRKLQAKPGQAAELRSSDQRVEVLLYPIDRPTQQISMGKSLRDRLGVKPGKARVSLRLLDEDQRTLEPLPAEIRIEAHSGSPDLWTGMVVGAPHGDCDMHTGVIVEEVSRHFKVPAVCAYGSRISFLGRWIDVNRPLQRRPNPETYGILPYRDWTEEATSIYSQFRENVLRVGTPPDSEPGSVPLTLYLDFHGHDLTVTAEDGKKIYRNVFECMARGFNLAEVRMLKASFDQCVEAEYGEQAPKSYWGNLPADRQYQFEGYPAGFFYSGLGGREYGILASNVARRAIHIESPNFVRVPESNRPRTARVLASFLQILRDELLPPSLERQSVTPPAEASQISNPWASVPAGEFLRGAPEGEGWDIERPQHWVSLSQFEISTTEVTCGEFAEFANEALRSGKAELRDEQLVDRDNGELWCTLWPAGNLSMLKQQDRRIVWRAGREHHPVNYVTWHGAMAMAAAGNATLPTEAQWERAAGWDSNTQRWFRTGMSLPQFEPVVQAALMNSGHVSENFVPPSTCPVGSFFQSRSPVGCFDMSGNVWEWTLDWLASYPQDGKTLQDPTGPKQGSMKVIRGGGWDTERSTATPSFRLGVSPDQALPNVGFRLAR